MTVSPDPHPPGPRRPGRVIIEVPAWLPSFADRGLQAAAILVAGAAAGFVAIGLGWAGAAARLYVSLQLPFVVSGVVGGVALTGSALAVLAIHLERRAQATDRQTLDVALLRVGELADRLPGVAAATLTRRPLRASAPLVVNGRTIHRRTCRIVAGRDLPPFKTPGERRTVTPCRICDPFDSERE